MSSPSELIVTSKTFSPSDVAFSPAKTDSRGGKKVSLTLNGSPLVISVPLMFTWGINERVDEATGRVSYDASLVFENEKSATISRFCDKLKEMQEKILTAASTEKSKEWFGKAKLSKEVAEAMMYPILKYPKNKETGEEDFSRNPSIKLQIPYWEGDFKVELYDMKGQALFLPPSEDGETPQGDNTPVDIVPSKSHIKGLIQCGGIWMAGGRFGVTWKLIQAQVRAPVRLLGTGVCHIVADSDDEDVVSDTGEDGEGKEDVSADVSADVNEEVESEKVEVEVEAAVKPKKKVVRRKKKAEVGAEE
jgi:hypothetical protein